MPETEMTMPDGKTVITFPAEMSQADIAKAMQQMLGTEGPPQMEGIGRLPAYVGSRIAKGALEGAGMIGNLADLGQGLATRYINDPIRHAIGLRDQVVPRDLLTGEEQTYPGAGGKSLQQLFPGARPEQLPDYLAANRDWLGPAPRPPDPLGSASLVNLGRAAGVVDRPDLQPQNAGERYLGAGAEGLGGMIPYAPLALGGAAANAARAAPGTIATLLRGGAQGVGSGLGGEAATELVPRDSALAPYLRAGGALLGGLGAAGVINAGGRVYNALAGDLTPTAQAYKNLGIDPTLAGNVTGRPGLQTLQSYAERSPYGTTRMRAQGEQAIDQFGTSVEDTASRLGSVATPAQLGDKVQMEAGAWLNNWNTAKQAAFNNLDMHVPPSIPNPVPNYKATLQSVANSMPTASASAQALQSDLGRNLLKALIKDEKTGPLSAQDVRGIRTRIGDMLGSPTNVGNTSHAELERLWGALSKDIEATVATRGPAAQQAFDDAMTVTREGHDFVKNTLSKLVRGNEIDAETAAKRALTGTGTFVQNLRAQMPQAADEVAAFKLRSMAEAPTNNPAGVQVSPSRFMVERGRMTPEQQTALFGADPAVAQRWSDLGTVADSMRGSERLLGRAAPQSGGVLNRIGQAATSFGGIGAGAGYLGGGVPGMVPGGAIGAAIGTGLAAAPALAGRGASYLTGLSPIPGLLSGRSLPPLPSTRLALPAALQSLLRAY